VIFNTHKIKPRKEYEILKQKNNRNGFYISFFCFKISYPFWRTSIFRINFFFKSHFIRHLSVTRKIKKINKKKVKVSSSFKKRKFKPTVFNKISTLHFRFASRFLYNQNSNSEQLHTKIPGSIFLKKLAFLETSTWEMTFFFFLFFLLKNLMCAERSEAHPLNPKLCRISSSRPTEKTLLTQNPIYSYLTKGWTAGSPKKSSSRTVLLSFLRKKKIAKAYFLLLIVYGKQNSGTLF